MSEGVGPNKKLAKRNAAESMLLLLGFNRPSPQPSKPAIKSTQSSEGSSSNSDKKVTFLETGKSNGGAGEKSDSSSTSTGCQVVPGLLRLNHSGAAHIHGLMAAQATHTFTGTNDCVSAVLSKAGPQAEDQANALAKYLKIPITFEEFTKSNSGSEYLTRVTLATQPPQMYHGTGPTREMSRDAAALSTTQNLLMLANAHSAAGDAGPLKTELAVNAALPRQLNGAGDTM